MTDSRRLGVSAVAHDVERAQLQLLSTALGIVTAPAKGGDLTKAGGRRGGEAGGASSRSDPCARCRPTWLGF